MNFKKIFVEECKSVIEECKKDNIDLIILRNYEFLLDDSQIKSSDTGIDVAIKSRDLNKLDKLFKKLGFIKRPKAFSYKHQGYVKYFSDFDNSLGFDVQIGGVYWNDMQYLDEDIFKNVKKIDFFQTLNDDYTFVMLTIHSILGKRFFKPKYKKILINLIDIVDFKIVNDIILRTFGKNSAEFIVQKIKTNNIDDIGKKSIILIFKFLLRSPFRIFTLSLLTFRWIIWSNYLTASPLISVIGPDGSGKSETNKMLIESLSNNNRKVKYIYFGRGRSNILPFTKLGRIYKRAELKKDSKNIKKRVTFLRKILYTLSSFMFTTDLLLRYVFRVFPKRKNRNIVMTDRYCSDILLMEHVPFFIKYIFLVLFPKPVITIYLYNDAQVLYDRRKQQSVDELNRQMNLFEFMVRQYSAFKIKTTDKKITQKNIRELVYNKLGKLGY